MKRPSEYAMLIAVCTLVLSGCGKVVGLGDERTLESDAGNPRLACEGVGLWIKRFGDAAGQTASTIAPDGMGGVYVAGYFEGALDFGGAKLVSNGGSDLFLAHLDAEGNHIWSRNFGTSTDQAGLLSVTTLENGVLLAGEIRGGADFGGGEHIAQGFADGFLAKYDDAGNFVWHRFMIGPSAQHSEAIMSTATDSAGAVYASAVFTETITFLDESYTSHGMKDLLVSKLTPDGANVWTLQFGGTGDEAANWVGTTASGVPVLGGSAAGAFSLGQEVLPTTSGWDMFLGTYDPNDGGAFTTRRYGGPGDTGVTRITSSPFASDFIVTGRLRYSATMDLGTGLLSAKDGAYVGRLHENLEPVASRAIDNFVIPYAAAVSAQGNIFVGGTFTDTATFDVDPVQSLGLNDAVLLQLDPQLDTDWLVQMGSESDDELRGVSVDPSTGATFAFGHFEKTLHIVSSVAQCADLTSEGGTDLFLMKLAP